MDQSRPRYKTLAEIFGYDNGDSPDAQIYRIFLDLDVRSEAELFQLPFYDRYIWLVSRFGEEVANGGIDQFLFNSSGDYTVETLEALAAIGASETHRALEQACELFPNGRPSEDHETRADQVREINARFGDRHIDEIVGCGKLDSNLAELSLDFRLRHYPTS
jgi:hypothetical protein